jgi:cell division protease FtsH
MKKLRRGGVSVIHTVTTQKRVSLPKQQDNRPVGSSQASNPASAPRFEGQSSQNSQPLSSWQNVLGKSQVKTSQTRSLHFGNTAEQAFDFQKFLQKDITAGLEDTYLKATQTGMGKDVAPEDWVLATLDHFAEDLASYQRSDDKRNYFGFSYFGKILGINNSLSFETDKAREIDALLKLRTSIQAELEAKSVPEESRTHNAGERMTKTFRVAKETLKNIMMQAPDKLSTASVLVNEDFIFQTLAKQDAESAGKWARTIFDELRYRPALSIEEYMSENAKSTDAKDIDAKKPQNLTDLAKKPDFVKEPGLSSQLPYLSEQLGYNHVKVLVLQVPKSISVDGAMATLAQYQAQKDGDQAAPIFKINLSKYFEGVEGEKGLEAFKTAIKDISRENPKAIIYLPGFESALRRHQREVDADFFSALNPNNKLKFIIPRVEGEKMEVAMPRNAHTMQAIQSGQLQITPWTLPNFPGLLQGTLEQPNVQETVSHIQEHHLKNLEEHHPGVKFTEAGIAKAVEMAALTKEGLLDTALEFLEVAAQRFPQGPLTEDRIKRAVKSDPHLGFATKVSLNGSYQRLGDVELTSLLEKVPQTVGAEKVKELLGKIASGIDDPTPFKQFGLKPVTRAIIAGSPGTAKTDMLLRFAKEEQLPLVYISGKELGHLQLEQMKKIVEQAFIAAKNESNRKENRGEAPHVMVVVDNLEAGARPAGNDPRSVTNPLAALFLMELEKLKEEENQHLITFGVTNSNLGFAQQFQDKELVDEIAMVEEPTLKERIDIFKALAKMDEMKAGKAIYADGIDFKQAAQQLTGVAGKTMQVVLDRAKEVAMNDAKNTDRRVTARHLDRAITDLTVGTENRKLNNLISPDNRRATAYHEMGHTMAFQKMKDFFSTKASQLLKVTVMPQGDALGIMFPVQEDEIPKQTKTELFAQLVCTVASMPAEQLSIHDITAGNSMDRKQATQLATAMITQVAMGKNKVVYKAPEGDISNLPANIQTEIQKLIETAEDAAEVILRGYAPFVEDIVDRLAGKDGTGGEETIMGEELIRALREFESKNPQVAEKVQKEVIKLMAPLFPEKQYQVSWGQKLWNKLFGRKPVFREMDRLKSKPEKK